MNNKLDTNIRKFWENLVKNELEKALSYFIDDAIVIWGPYKFNGKAEIGKKWMEEFMLYFDISNIFERKLILEGKSATHEITIHFRMTYGSRGELPLLARYEFEDQKIKQLEVTPSDGHVIIPSDEIKLHVPKYQIEQSLSRVRAK